jgi:hypothetical protein
MSALQECRLVQRFLSPLRLPFRHAPAQSP